MRWILLLVSLAAFGVAFLTKSPAVLGLALLVGGIAFFAAGFAFIGRRVESVSQGQSSREMALLMTTRPRVDPPNPSAPSTSAAAPRPPAARPGPVPPPLPPRNPRGHG